MVLRELSYCHEVIKKALKEPGMTISQLSEDTELSESTIKKFVGDPYFRGKPRTEKAVLDALAKQESPFSEWSNWIHGYIDQVWAIYKNPDKLIAHIDNLVIKAIKNDPELDRPSFDGCRLQWAFARALYVKGKALKDQEQDGWKEFYQKATARYMKALRAIEAQEASEDQVVCIGKIHVNILSLMFEQCNENTRSTDPNIIKWLEDEEYLDRVDDMMKYDKNNKMLRHNGMIVAGMLERWEEVDTYADWLLERVPRLMEPGYTYLTGMRPLAEDPDAVGVYKRLLERPKFTVTNRITKQ